jgi:hypothetical protein
MLFNLHDLLGNDRLLNPRGTISPSTASRRPKKVGSNIVGSNIPNVGLKMRGLSGDTKLNLNETSFVISNYLTDEQVCESP